MAEKEQRIWFEYDIPKPKGAVEATRCTIMTRQEAINRMAKALFNFQYDGGLSFENAYDGAKKEFRLFAEAALKALLEGK